MILRMMKYFVAYIIFEAFYVYYYYSNTKWSDNFMTFKDEYNQTGQAAIYFLYAMSLTEYVLMRQDFNELERIRKVILPEISNKISNIQENHILYGRNIGEEFNDNFLEITNENLCDHLTMINTTIDKNICLIPLHGSLTEGLFAALTDVRNTLIQKIDYVYYLNATYFTTDKNTLILKLIEAGNDMNMVNLLYMYPSFIQPFLQHLLILFSDSITKFIEQEFTLQFYFLVFFIIIVFLFQIICSLIVRAENKKAKELALIITIIPPYISVNNKIIVDQLKKYSNTNK